MTTALVSVRRSGAGLLKPGYLVFVVTLLAMWLTGLCLRRYVPLSQWSDVLLVNHPADLRLLVVRDALLPRCVVSIVGGASLGLAGVMLQHVLRNPLADPTTLGVSAGASLSLTVVSLWYPGLLGYGSEWIAIAGAAVALCLVMAISWHRGFSSIGVILAGLLVTLTVGATTSVFTLFFGEGLIPVFMWQTGDLHQNGWSGAVHLSIGFVSGAALVALISGPLSVLELGDEGARSVGQRPGVIRAAAILISAGLTAIVVSAVGIIGFIGLVAPWLARLSGARTLGQRLFWGPITAGCLLWLADGCVQLLGQGTTELPTGSVTALFGTPFLIWMLSRLGEAAPSAPQSTTGFSRRRAAGAVWIVGGTLLLIACAALSATFNRELGGWTFGSWQHVEALLPLRAPRIVGAIAAGFMLAIAGVVMQRITGNPMASPEVLGISSGALLGMVVLMFVLPQAKQEVQVLAAAAGASIVLLVMFSLSRRATFSPDRLVLTGVAITTVLGSIVSILIASGDPRVSQLQAWMSGSTYHVGVKAAVVAASAAVAVLAAVPFISRPLEIMTLGDQSACSVGVDLRRYRGTVLALCAAATGAATLIVGPVSFVGLLGPHLARMFGFRRVMSQVLGACIMGALLMSVADWLGRNLVYPNQVPAGLLVMFIGGPYFLVLMWKQK